MIDERTESFRDGELLASGEYESKSDEIMKGFKTFQRRYVFKNVAIQITLLAIAAVIQFANIAVSGVQSVNIILLLVLLAVGLFILQKPRLTYNKLAEAIKDLDGIIYRAEMFTDKIIVTTVYDPQNDIKNEDEDKAESDENAQSGEEEKEESSEEKDSTDDLPPATIIKLTEGVVDVLCTEDQYIAYIKGRNIYVIPRSAFSDEENARIAEKYPVHLGTKFIVI